MAKKQNNVDFVSVILNGKGIAKKQKNLFGFYIYRGTK